VGNWSSCSTWCVDWINKAQWSLHCCSVYEVNLKNGHFCNCYKQLPTATFCARQKPFAVSAPRDCSVSVLDPKQSRQYFGSIIQQRCTFCWTNGRITRVSTNAVDARGPVREYRVSDHMCILFHVRVIFTVGKTYCWVARFLVVWLSYLVTPFQLHMLYSVEWDANYS